MRSGDEDRVPGLDDSMTAPLRAPRVVDQRSRPRGVSRAITGALTAGLVLLALGVLAAQLLINEPGPGSSVVILHLIGAGAAVVLQLLADRNRGPLGWWCIFGVLLVASCVLWFGWYQ